MPWQISEELLAAASCVGNKSWSRPATALISELQPLRKQSVSGSDTRNHAVHQWIPCSRRSDGKVGGSSNTNYGKRGLEYLNKKMKRSLNNNRLSAPSPESYPVFANQPPVRSPSYPIFTSHPPLPSPTPCLQVNHQS